MIACMGGWCLCRDRCQNYYEERGTPVERLCGYEEEPSMPDSSRFIFGKVIDYGPGASLWRTLVTV